MTPAVSTQLQELLTYPERTAGGLMTSRLMLAHPRERVGDVRERLASETDEQGDLDGIVIVDDDGRLLDDLRLVELFVADPDDVLEHLVASSDPITLDTDAGLTEVVDRLIDSRRTSVLVTDDGHHPIGRILADDVIDALVPTRGRHRVHVHRP